MAEQYIDRFQLINCRRIWLQCDFDNIAGERRRKRGGRIGTFGEKERREAKLLAYSVSQIFHK